MKKLGLALILTALVAFAAVATASARSGAATTSSATSPQTSSHSGDSGPGHDGDGSGRHGGDDDDDGHHGGHHGDDDGDRREAGEDNRGNCDEAEHARDAHCVGVVTSRSNSSSNSNSSASSSSNSNSNATSPSSKSKRIAVGTKLVANVGPGFSITLKTAKGAAVKALRAGTYTVTVRDRSDEHNFRLSGKGFNKATSVDATTTQTWRVQFKAGTYTFQCDPHAQVMRGTVRVS